MPNNGKVFALEKSLKYLEIAQQNIKVFKKKIANLMQ